MARRGGVDFADRDTAIGWERALKERVNKISVPFLFTRLQSWTVEKQPQVRTATQAQGYGGHLCSPLRDRCYRPRDLTVS